MNNKPDYMIYCDGGARGNPGPAAYGFVIYDEQGSKIYEEGRVIGSTTNNVAEYSAVIAALKYISDQSVFRHPKSVLRSPSSVIRVFLDSQLAAMQLSGKWKIKNEKLRDLYFIIRELEEKIGGKFNYSNIPREQNREADRLVNLALDGKT